MRSDDSVIDILEYSVKFTFCLVSFISFSQPNFIDFKCFLTQRKMANPALKFIKDKRYEDHLLPNILREASEIA